MINKKAHWTFIYSPLLFIILISIMIMMESTFRIPSSLISLGISAIEWYSLLYFLGSIVFFYQLNNQSLEEKEEHSFLLHSYPNAATIFFAWFFLLPVMKETVGMWDYTFLNFMVTLALSNFIFYSALGMARLVNLLNKKESASNQ